MKTTKGRPTETPAVVKEKRTDIFYEIPSKPEIGCKTVFHFDINKNINGPYKTEISYPKNMSFPKPKIEKRKAYNKQPVVMVFKTSNRSNAQTKMKIWANENIDFINTSPSLPGVPDNAIILECGVGETFIKIWKEKYNI
jgi:hypothetical protein